LTRSSVQHSRFARANETRWAGPDTHRSNAGLKRRPKCSVVVANDVFRCAVPREGFSDLTRQPLRRRIAGHRKPQQSPPFVTENQKCEQLLKRNRRNHKEDQWMQSPRYDCEGRSSRSARPIRPGHHIDRNCGLGDLDAQLEQLAMDLSGVSGFSRLILRIRSRTSLAIRGRPPGKRDFHRQ